METRHIREAESGVRYASWVLKQKLTVVTEAVLMRIGGNGPNGYFTLKLGRYRLPSRELETPDPKSKLTLDKDEFSVLCERLSETVPAMREGCMAFIPLDNSDIGRLLVEVRRRLAGSDTREAVHLLLENDFLRDDLLAAVNMRQRRSALDEFREMLGRDLTEPQWQPWFEANPWVLGSDCVVVLEERRIDPHNIADYLVETYDGHVDIIEIKRPSLPFWGLREDHGNLVPSRDLVKAITQAHNYQFELEREMDSQKTQERLGDVPITKPRALLIFGRSSTWELQERRAQRLLNAGLTSVQVLSYDQVLARAERMLQPSRPQSDAATNGGAAPDIAGNGDGGSDDPFGDQ